jgi:methyl-accepting chemotaxis protein
MAESRTKPTKAKSSDNRIEKMFKAIAKGLKLTNQRLGHMEKNTNQRFDRSDQRLDRMEKSTNQRFDHSDQRLDRMEKSTNQRFDRSDQRLDHLEEVVEQIHHTVIKIENVHGDKINAFGEGLQLTNERFDRMQKDFNDLGQYMEKRFDRLEVQVSDIKTDVKEIKETLAVITPTVSDHETRLGVVESSLQAHISKHL